ncbi:hypothetical protein ACHAXR_006245 [Thalassiosira sp. AJA248-18]
MAKALPNSINYRSTNSATTTTMTTPPSRIVNTTPRRPRSSRLHYAILGLFIFAISCTIIFWDGRSSSRLLLRRQLAYLDTIPAPTIKYGRTDIDQNYQSLIQPSGIDSSIFRKQAQERVGAGAKGYTEETACDDIFLFMPQMFAHNGHGSQLNNYLLAAMIATFTNKAMVILDAPPEFNALKSNSQFGCPPEAWETVMVRKGGEPKRVGWNNDFPNGLERLIKHPAWLSRKCPVPCQDSHGYEQWEEARQANYNATEVPIPQQVTCQTNGRNTKVLVMGGPQVRDYFIDYYKDQMIDRAQPPSLPGAEWALRLGAAPHEARVFGSLTDRYQLWDYASALMSRSGILRFQPWIARDVEAYIQDQTELPLDVPYDAVHVRRGDKLKSDARRFVIKYWAGLNLYDEESGETARDYIPFEHYLSEFNKVECTDEPRLVYVATDDPAEVKNEIAELPQDSEGYHTTKYGCHKFQFILTTYDSEVGYHIDAGASKANCEDRYARNIAGIADLMILTRSDIFVGEFNSNWGRLVRTFRLKVNDSAKVMNGARPVLERNMKVAWGNQRPGPPGW